MYIYIYIYVFIYDYRCPFSSWIYQLTIKPQNAPLSIRLFFIFQLLGRSRHIEKKHVGRSGFLTLKGWLKQIEFGTPSTCTATSQMWIWVWLNTTGTWNDTATQQSNTRDTRTQFGLIEYVVRQFKDIQSQSQFNGNFRILKWRYCTI